MEEECQVAPHTFKRALKEVIRDSEIKDLYFTSSLTMTTKRPHEQASSSLALPGTGPSPQPRKQPKGVAKAKEKEAQRLLPMRLLPAMESA